MKICTKCGEHEAYDAWCLPCRRTYSSRRAAYNGELVGRWKRMRGCIDCGYKESYYALELDHRPGTTKESTQRKGYNRTWSKNRIKEELAKCDVRCANCHAVKTAERRNK